MKGTFWRLICNTQAEHVSIAQAAEANQLQETLVGSAEQPRDSTMQEEVLTHTILQQRGGVPQGSGTLDKFQADESKETGTAC